MKKIITSTIAVFALSLGACSATSGSPDDAPTSGTNRPSSSSTSADSAPEEAETADLDEMDDATGGDSDVLAFGDTQTYEDGVSLTVGEPEQISLTEFAYPEVAEATAFQITVVNGTDAPIDPTEAFATVQSGNTEAEEVYDENVGELPMTSILPDREATFTVAFAASDPSDLVMEIAPTWEHENAIFTNTN